MISAGERLDLAAVGPASGLRALLAHCPLVPCSHDGAIYNALILRTTLLILSPVACCESCRAAPTTCLDSNIICVAR